MTDAITRWIGANIWYLLFVAWGLPLGYYRSRFRKLVYRTDSWTIVVQPRFLKELQALFGTLYPDDPEYLKLRNFYRFYLAIYVTLFSLWLAIR
jgi:peroxiredoxin Q/BCP